MCRYLLPSETASILSDQPAIRTSQFDSRKVEERFFLPYALTLSNSLLAVRPIAQQAISIMRVPVSERLRNP